MAKFRLKIKDDQGNKIGNHVIGTDVYHAGDVVDTKRPLDKIYRNKFERVPDATPASTPTKLVLGTVDLPDVEDELLERPVIQKPDVAVPHDVAPFEELPMPGVVVAEEGAVEDNTNTVPSDISDSETAERFGIDVTDEFGGAESANVKVYFKGKNDFYSVVDNESGKVLKRTKKEETVGEFVGTLL